MVLFLVRSNPGWQPAAILENSVVSLQQHGFLVSVSFAFYPRDAMLARVIAIATCLSVCLSVCPSRAHIVSKRRKLAS